MKSDFKSASKLTKAVASASAALSLLTLGGCATTASMMSGDDQQNAGLCVDFAQAQKLSASLPIGTPKDAVYGAFGLKDETHLRTLSKQEVNRSLYGTDTLNIPFEQRERAQGFLNSVEGVSLACRNVHAHRHIGLTHTQLTETGVDYTLTFIFDRAKNTLYDPVQVAGAPVDKKTNNGYLQNLNPGDTAIHAATRGL